MRTAAGATINGSHFAAYEIFSVGVGSRVVLTSLLDKNDEINQVSSYLFYYGLRSTSLPIPFRLLVPKGIQNLGFSPQEKSRLLL